MSASALIDAAGVSGAFDRPRLGAALGSLTDRGCFVRLDDERLRITLVGYQASTNAPAGL
ncbi:MAG: hypothetical protein KA085_19475, partial [Phenylobacterium sp.]|uniref:hypothetical protein n=1 Tax=Phenylobacterium sp. TaxID=1871053 RepID=UPI001B548C7E